MEDNICETIDRLRNENSVLLLHLNGLLNNAGHKLSPATIIQLRAAKADAEKSFNHIVASGELFRFGQRLQ
jgi:hypothetical protein